MSRLRFVWERGRLSREASDELRFHRELLVARYVESGMAPDAARLAAERQLGNVVLVQEDIYRMNSIRWLDVLIHDLRYAFRVVRQESGICVGRGHYARAWHRREHGSVQRRVLGLAEAATVRRTGPNLQRGDCHP